MQLVGILEMKSYEKIKEFLNDEHVGRISSIDVSGFPQIIPMNFVFLNDAIYMHSHVKGEKLDNISNNDKGIASFVTDKEEKTLALNGLMEKYQPEGFYDPLKSDMRVLDAVSVIKINPQTLHGKYKIGQHMSSNDRMILAKKILEKNSATAKTTLKIMGFEEIDGGLRMIDEPKW